MQIIQQKQSSIVISSTIKRLLENALIHWKEKTDRKPLILKGVRQCGKTYLIKSFTSQNYEDYSYFNFEENNALIEVFENDFDIQRIILELSILQNKLNY